MRIPKVFVKDEKILEEKVKEYSLDVAEGEVPGSFNEDEMTYKICEYVGTHHLLYSRNDRNMIKEQVHQLNYKKPKILREINEKISRLEAELEKHSIEWAWVASDAYSESAYKNAKLSIRRFWMKRGMVYYSSIVNYVPVKVATLFFNKADKCAELPTKWDLLGMASYVAVLIGETILVNAVLGYWWLFASLAVGTGIVHGITAMEHEAIEQDKNFVKEYKKVLEKKEIVDRLRREKQHIVELIKDHIKTTPVHQYFPLKKI